MCYRNCNHSVSVSDNSMSAESCKSHATDTLKWHWCLYCLHDEHDIAISLSGVCLFERFENLYNALSLELRGIYACIKSHFFNVAFSCCLSGLQSLRVVFTSSGFAGHWIWQSFQVLPTRTARGSPVLARGACLYRALCPAGAWLDACLPLKRQQWHLMTWKVLCKPSVLSVFRNGTVCCVQRVSPVLSWERAVWSGVWSHAKAYHRTGSEGKMSVWVFWLLTVFGFADCCLKCCVGNCKLDSSFPLMLQVLMCPCRVVESKRAAAAVYWRNSSCVCKHTVHVGSHVSFRQMCVEFLIIDCDLCSWSPVSSKFLTCLLYRLLLCL